MTFRFISSFTLIALTAFTIAGFTLAYQAPLAYDLDTRGATLDGFHALERGGGRAFRWSDGRARIEFAGIGQQPYRLTLTLSGSRPANVEPPTVRALVNGTAIGTFKTTRAVQDYTFDLLLEDVGARSDLTVRIESETFVPPNDLRTLGVALYVLRVEPSARAFAWPALLSLVWGVVVALTLQLFMDVAWPNVKAAIIIPIVAVLALSIGLAQERLLTVSVLPVIALIAMTAYVTAQIKQRTTWLETIAIVAVGLSALHFVLEFLNLFRISRFSDVTTMFEAAQRLAQGTDPYDYDIVRDNPLYAHSYVYPPPFAQFLELFLPLGLRNGIVVWVVLNFLLYFVVVYALARICALRGFGLYAFLFVAFNYRPVLDTLYGGQLDVMILALLTLSLVCAQRRRMFSSGVALALAAITKLHAFAIAPFYLTRQRWRGLIGMAVALAFILWLSISIISPELYARYFSVVLPGRGGTATGHAENQTVTAFFYRLEGVVWDDVPTTQQTDAIRGWTYGVSAVLGLATVGVMWWAGRRAPSAFATSLSFCAFITLMLLILPTAWMHYEAQLLLPYAVLLSYAVSVGERRLLIGWMISAALTAFANQDLLRDRDLDTLPLVLLQSYKFYGVLLLWLLLIGAQWTISHSRWNNQ